MPGVHDPQEGVQGFHAQIRALERRIYSLEVTVRQTRGMPAGTITRWAGAGVPPGALACDGSVFDPVAHPGLYAALGGSTLPSIAGTPAYIIWT